MTVSSAVRKAGPYIGNGSQTVYPFAFKIYTKNDIEVITADTNGLETTLTVDSLYSVTINADQDNNPGGYITLLVAALTLNYSLVILGNLPDQQLTDLTNLGGFFPQTVEDMDDRNTILIQQLAEKVDRSVQVPATSTLDPADLVDTIIAANTAATNFFGVYYGAYPANPSTDPLGNPPNSGDMYYNTVAHQLLIYDATLLTWTTQPSGASMTSNVFTGNGVLVNFTLSTTPYTINNLLVYVGGVAQRPTTDYTVAGTTLTFVVAPPNAANNVLAFVLNSILIGSIDGANIFNTVTYTKIKYDRTPAEIVAGVTPTNYYYQPGDVRRYGAVGDGVTDDTAAIQRAINAAVGNGGRVYLPKSMGGSLGTYRTTAALTISNRVLIYGDGIGYSGIVCAANSCFTIAVGVGFVEMKDFAILQAVRYTTTPNAYKGIDIQGTSASPCQYHVYRDLFIDGFLTPIQADAVQECVFDNVKTTFSFNGILSNQHSVNVFVTNCKLVGGILAASVGIQVGDGTAAAEGWSITDNLIYGFDYGVWGFGSNNSVVRGNIIDFFTQYGVILQSLVNAATNWIIESNYMAATGAGASSGIRCLSSIASSDPRGNRIVNNDILVYGGSVLVNGILMDGTQETKNTIHGNHIRATNFDVVISSGTGHIVTGNQWLNLGANITVKVIYDDNIGPVLTNPNTFVIPPLYASLQKVLTYSASMTPDLSTANSFTIAATNNTPFAINAPTNEPANGGLRLRIRISNTSGGALGAVTWNAIFKVPAGITYPATGFNRTYEFELGSAGFNYYLTVSPTVDIPN